MPWLIRRLDTGQVWSLIPGIDLGLGRAADVALHLPDPTVSGRQAVIDWQGDRPRLTNLSQTNPTVLDGQPVGEAVPLRPGATIYCGSIALRVEQIAEASAVPAPAPSRPGARATRRRWPLFAGLGAGVSLLVCVALIVTAILGAGLVRAPVAAIASPAPSPSPAPTATPRPLTPDELALKALREVIAPRQDPYQFRDEHAERCGVQTDRLVYFPRLNVSEGQKQRFYVLDTERETTLRYITPNVYLYTEDTQDVDMRGARQVVDFFQARIYPTVRETFGEEWPSEQDDDKHVTIVVAQLGGNIAGYFFRQDILSRAAFPTSNERRIFYVDAQTLNRNPDFFQGALAHEFQHMVNFRVRKGSDAWVNEGASDVAFALVGADRSDSTRLFMNESDVQLNGWDGGESNQPRRVLAHYEAGALFLTYFYERHGGSGILKEWVTIPGNGMQQYSGWLARHAPNETFDGVFADWLVANYVNDPAAGDGHYAYQAMRQRHAADKTHTAPAQEEGEVRHYAPRGVELRPGQPGDYELRFQGSPRTRLVGAEPSGSAIWYGNNGSQVATRLVREFDLTGVQRATLESALWYDLDQGSQATIEVSTDGGCTWKALRGRNTRGTASATPGSSQVFAYTGVSGGGTRAEWIDEVTDLSAYAGRKLLLRYAFDPIIYVERPGFAVGRVGIPEIGFRDDLSGDAGWQAQGFVRVLNDLPEQWLVRLVKYQRGGRVTVEAVPLGPDQTAAVSIPDLGGQTERALLVFAAATPLTYERVRFQYSFARK